MNFFIFSVAFLALLNSGHSLKCYKCNGCETTSMTKETCRNPDPETQIAGCMTQRLRTGGTADSMTIRKCAVYGKDERFECTTLPSGETILCQICHGDFCNSGSKVKTNFYLCLSLLFVFFIPKFFC